MQAGTGFLIEIERRLFLVTALHVVADARPVEPTWAKSVTATLDDESLLEFETPPIAFDPKHDWVAYEVKRSRKAALATGRACAHHQKEKLSSYGFPIQTGQAGLTGELSSLDLHVQWPAHGTLVTRQCLQATMIQVQGGLELPGFSGAPVAVGEIVVGMVSGYLAVGPASGFVHVDGMTGIKIPAGTRFRRGDGETYLALHTTTLAEDGNVEVQAERLGAMANCRAHSTMEFEVSDLGTKKVTVVKPGICGGADELARTAAEQTGKAIGGIVLVTPVERIVERLQGIVDPNRPSLDAHKMNVRAQIEAKLRAMKFVGPELAKECSDWALDGQSADRLAGSVLELDSPQVLAERFARTMRRIAMAPMNVRKAMATTALDIFEIALPVIAGPRLLVTVEKRLYKMSLLERGVAEAAMACEDRGKITMREVPETGSPLPRYYISLEDQPEFGLEARDGVVHVLEDMNSRIPPLVKKILASEGKLEEYPDPTLADVNSVMFWAEMRKFFTIVRRNSLFVEELSRSLSELRIIISNGTAPREYRDMIAPMAALYRSYYEIQRAG